MTKRTRLAACAAILSLATLGACASDKQVNLQKAAYDTMSAYHVAATGAEAYLASGNINTTVIGLIEKYGPEAWTTIVQAVEQTKSGTGPTTADIVAIYAKCKAGQRGYPGVVNFDSGIALGFVLGAACAVGYLLIAFARDCWRQGRME